MKSEFHPDHIYFVTTRVIRHIHLLKGDSSKRLIVDSLHYLRATGRMKLFAFVIMPNHIHLIAQFSVDHTLAAIMRDFKRYTARHLINELKSRDDQRTLLRLRRLNQDPRQNLKVWEDDYDSRAIFSALVLQKKLDYIHLNPCQKTWHLADDPTEYIWSSARFYMADQPAIIPVNDVREFLAGDSAGA